MNARRRRVKLAGGSNRKLWRRVLERDGWRCQGCESASAAAISLADTVSERRKRLRHVPDISECRPVVERILNTCKPNE
jgi:hypothetical protein